MEIEDWCQVESVISKCQKSKLCYLRLSFQSNVLFFLPETGNRISSPNPLSVEFCLLILQSLGIF